MHLSHDPIIHHSEQKCTHLCSAWCIAGYWRGALWDWSASMSCWHVAPCIVIKTAKTGLNKTSKPQMHPFHRILMVLLRWTIFEAISLHSQCNRGWASMCFMVGCGWIYWSKCCPFNQPYTRWFLLPWWKCKQRTKLLPEPRNTSWTNMVLRRARCRWRGQLWYLGILFASKMS